MANTVDISIIDQAYGNGSSWTDYVTWAVACGAISSRKYPYMLHFRTGSVPGRVKKIVFNLQIEKKDNDILRLYCSLLTSDSNKYDYLNRYTDYNDPNSLSKHTVSFSLKVGHASYPIEFSDIVLKPNTDYYLALWSTVNSGNQATIRSVSEHNGYLVVESGLAYIDNGSGWDAYQIYIDNGSGWDAYVPYVDNGSGWDLYG